VGGVLLGDGLPVATLDHCANRTGLRKVLARFRLDPSNNKLEGQSSSSHQMERRQ